MVETSSFAAVTNFAVARTELNLAFTYIKVFLFPPGMYQQLRDELGLEEGLLSYARFPIEDEKAPRELDFDMMKDTMRAQDKDTACVFNCQVSWNARCLCNSSFVYRYNRVARA